MPIQIRSSQETTGRRKGPAQRATIEKQLAAHKRIWKELKKLKPTSAHRDGILRK